MIKIEMQKKGEARELDKFVKAQWDEFHQERGYEYKVGRFSIIARDNEVIVGYAFFEIIGGVGHISEIIVDKKYRSKGIGKMLIEKVEEICKEKKCHEIFLETSQKHTEAISFYKKNGYELRHTLKNFKFGFDWYMFFKKL